ncbi:MAG: hypothetical protein KBC56_06920 [Flavobacterium sp.]|nr:hypothetical protein [Flavobacterium sp.]
MKNLLFCLLIAFFFVSCSSAQSNSSQERGGFPVDITFSTQSDFISEHNGCFTIQVRVYMTAAGQTYLVASGNAQIGSCGRVGPNNPICKNEEIKGDYFINSDSKDFKYCLTECIKDERVYKQYESEKYRILSELKKR